MMADLFGLIFMIPLSLMISFWFFQYLFIFLMFIYMLGYNFSFMGKISFILGNDLISYFLVMLSYWICILMIMASAKLFWNSNYASLFLMINNFLMISLFLTFFSLNLFSFYLFFEVSIIPTLILIMGWGYQPERIEAGMYLLFYTMFFSLPMMVGIFFMYKCMYSLFFFKFHFCFNYLLYLSLNMVFMVKIPMFFLHLWLPKAHVEAPVSGSMILAGVMLKLGGYGMIRLMKIFLPIWFKINFYFIIISLFGGIVVSFICLYQSDMKSLIAYSSVSHMGMAMSGILTMNNWGMSGAYILMLAHGLCSSGLFCLANMNYERVLSRSIYLNKGMMVFIPSLSFWWFMFCISNMAAPPSLNLLGEIFLINSLVMYSNYLMFLLGLISFMSAAYSLFLFSYIQHGVNYSGMFSFFMGCSREYLVLFLHWFPLVFLTFKGDLILL
uniref:NADH-ubiquinone oxidoreductase chain 4 n=1 Tax=Trichochrysea japana TaxID=3073295 RepID=A0AA51NNM6_9CUCU|nr:NADH dehydrogenase subunit 4 [Trichochrysea japana]WMQ75985.1 NADH dehydrogenase subunit 4 [Trichochrysea japana]